MNTQAKFVHLYNYIYIYIEREREKELTSSSPTEWLRWWLGTSLKYPGIVFFEETSMSLVSLCILLIRATLASSSSSNLDCIFTWPSSNYPIDNRRWLVNNSDKIILTSTASYNLIRLQEKGEKKPFALRSKSPHD